MGSCTRTRSLTYVSKTFWSPYIVYKLVFWKAFFYIVYKLFFSSAVKDRINKGGWLEVWTCRGLNKCIKENTSLEMCHFFISYRMTLNLIQRRLRSEINKYLDFIIIINHDHIFYRLWKEDIKAFQIFLNSEIKWW